MAGILTIALTGGLFGFFFLPSNLFGLGGIRIGVAVFFLLGALLKAVVNEVRTTRYSHRALFWWSVTLLTTTIGGAMLGSLFLPGTLLVSSRALLGACLGCIGLIFPIVLIRVFRTIL